jgi:hypothetical protein
LTVNFCSHNIGGAVHGFSTQHDWRGLFQCKAIVAALATVTGIGTATTITAQTTNNSAPASALPEIVVSAPKAKPKPTRVAKPRAPAETNNIPTRAQAALDAKMTGFDQARDNLLPKIGASTSIITRAAIESLPQADNAPIDKVILQFPGVSYDSAVSNPAFHVRNEYANVQIRINGIVLPEGVSALGPVIDTNFVGSMSLLTGTLPAQYGLRTAGVLDITSRSFATPGGRG